MALPPETRTPIPWDEADQSACQRVLAGDTAAYSEIVRRHEGRLRRLVRAIVADIHLGEDVLQEVFLQAYLHLPSYRAEASLGTWLYRIAVREAQRARSRWKRAWRVLVPFDEVAKASALVTNRVATPEEFEVLLRVLGRIPERERTPFVLHAVEGWSYTEIAQLLGCSTGTVGSWIHRARKRVQELRLRERDLPERCVPGGGTPSPPGAHLAAASPQWEGP
ncbi:MAG: RNA polymerase sigma factor [Planctomycetota bacterium]